MLASARSFCNLQRSASKSHARARFTPPRIRAILRLTRWLFGWYFGAISSILAVNLGVNGREERQARVERWAKLVESRGLSSLALPLLEMADAFGVLASQALLMVMPLAGGALGEGLEETADLLGNPELRGQLRTRLTRGYDGDD